MDSSALSASQRRTLTQLQALTNGDAKVTKSVLESVDWDVQVSTRFVFRPLQCFVSLIS